MTTNKLGTRSDIHARRLELLRWLDNEEFVTCYDLGGTNGSPHSADLTYLCKRGLAERKRHYVQPFSGGHWRYRRTCAGNLFLYDLNPTALH